ncbi:hypothetical protein RN001_011287 [Aquatica leii]|uniref:Peptidase S1 domain-containing protein n=1 Tax=Aquatica leii TaxID=1421715 RepID=A0AAN7PBS3_9COLE|nr:hypothetical protein RN001_011287 [Aquatica leii]
MVPFIIILLVQLVLAQKPSPCPSLFAYEPKGIESDRWYGQVSVATTEVLNGVWLRIELDKPAILLGNWFGETTTENNRDFLITDRGYVLEPNRKPLSVRFFVKYDQELGIVPSVVRIKLNGKLICHSGNDATNDEPKLHISHIKPNVDIPKPVVSISSNDDDFFSGDLSPTRRPLISLLTPTPEKETCGTVKIEVRPLITYGQSTSDGEWPWHAALYRYKGANMQYLCGGSLVTRNHVITAAHCVTKSKTNLTVNQELLLIYLGKHNLYKQDTSVQNMGVNKIVPHPEYNASYLHNDIAILELERPAEITNFVRYVCLWEEDTNLNTILDRLGTVVGWGFDESGDVTESLMQAKMPVVSTETCIFSNRDFFSRFTSDKTFCAGFRNGTSACTGDSGGGMVFPKPNTGNTLIWQLRGVISLSAALQNEKVVCDTSNYIVFTDVAKHLDWIKSIIN